MAEQPLPIESLPLDNTEEIYTVTEIIYSGSSTCITRASHKDNSYIVKSNIKLLQHQKKLKKYYKEYSIGSSVNSPYVVKYVDFKRLGYGFAMIMNDIGGVTLKSIIPAKGFDIDQFLDIAIRIVQGLGAIHAAGVTHKDINPANIVINTNTTELNIIDFGMASQLHRNEVSPITSNSVLQGTIIYMSPEQTGRMNRVVDYRTDYYSLGITFYELLAGEPPFSHSVDPLDLIYKHIAVYPRPLVEVRPEVEKPLSDVIAKMMSKNAEDRYQDCYGLLLDLRDLQRARRITGTTQCLISSTDSLNSDDMEDDNNNNSDNNNITTTNGNGEDEGGKGERKKRKRRDSLKRGFVPGSRDLVRVLRVSQKLYGREDHVKKLSEIFEHVCEGQPEIPLVLVHGYSGVGKTLLVHEVHKPLAKSRGNYISGKFEQYMSASPYSGLVQAIKQLIQQILTESEDKLQQWRQRILDNVGSNGQLIIDMIPEVEFIIGPQQPIQTIGTAETMHRHKEVLPSFIFALACKEHPLVIFLDDLQWADSMTLSLLVVLLNPEHYTTTNADKNPYLLILGSYRDNEVDYSHPLSVSLRETSKKGGKVEDIQLLSLSEPEVVQLLDDTFNTQRGATVNTTVLGQLVHTKTQGNPFFVNQLLVTLHKHGHIRPIDPYGPDFTLEEIEETEAKARESKQDGCIGRSRGGWICDMEAIQAANYTSNVVDLMVGALKTLPSDVQKIIGMAATIGNQFDLSLLAGVCGLSEHTTAYALRGAVKGEFLIPSSDEVLEGPITDNRMDARGIVLINAPHSPILQTIQPPRRASYSNLSTISGSMTYRFAHDRVQQASLSLLSKDDQKLAHMKLAEQMLLKVQDNERALNQLIHQIVNHVNTGLLEEKPPLLMIAQRDDHSVPANGTSYLPFSVYSVASLNMLAASKAKSTNAYFEAMQFTDFGIRLLEAEDPDRAWREQHSLVMGLHKLRAELRTLCGDFSEAPCTYLLPRARSLIEKAEVFILIHDRHEAESNMPAALNVVFECLELLGVSLPRESDEQKKAFLLQLSEMQKKLNAFHNVVDLIHLPDCTDAIQLSIFKLLSSVWIAAYMMGHVYLAGLVCTLTVIRSVDYGMCAHTGKAMVANTLHSLAITQDYFYLNNLAKAGLHILDTRYPQYKSLRGAAYLLYGVGLSTWIYPLSECLQYLEASYNLNKQSGNYLWMTYVAHYLFEYPIMFGQSLEQVAHEFEKTLPFWKEEGSKYAMHTFMELMAQPIWELSGIPKIGGDNVEESIIEKIPLYKAGYNYVRLFCSYFMGERAHLLHYADVASELVPICFMGVYRIAETEVWASLVYLDWLSRSSLAMDLYSNPKRKRSRHAAQGNDADIDSEAEQDRNTQIENMKKRLEKIGQNIQHMSEAARFSEANFHHKALLMRAELARVALMFGSTAIYAPTKWSPSDSICADQSDQSEEEMGNKQDFEVAIKIYEAAIESARRYGFQQFEALGLELYGQFWLTAPTKPNEKFALTQYSEAVVVCEKWGAMAKASLLRDKCSRIFPNESTRTITSIRSKKSAITSSLDLDVIVQAAQTISNEVDFDTLVVKMVKAIVENANAQRGTFFLCEKEDPNSNSNLWVAAEYSYQNKIKNHEDEDNQETNSLYTQGISLLQPKIPVAEWKNGPKSIVNYVCRTLHPVVLNCAHDNNQFWTDEYIAANRVKSVICMPILLKNSLKGAMYIENNLCEGLYCKSHVDLLKVLTSQMAISIENIDFLHFQIEKQSEKLRFEQLQREEKIQRERADAAEKYKFQLENFIDMICHEIRNPLNGIFGNTDLIFYYLEAIEEILQKQKLIERTGAVPPSVISCSPKNSPTRMKKSNPKATSVEEAKQALASHVSTAAAEKEQAKNPEKLIFYLLEQLVLSTNSIQKCAEHQKCMTDDVLQLSRLRSHKLAITNTYYHPWDTLMTAITIFKPQAESKGLYIRLQPEGGNYESTELLGDAVRIYQILSNLISNALKFTHRGGVTITFSITDLPDAADSQIPTTPTYSPAPITPLSTPSSASSSSSYHHSAHFPFPSPRGIVHSTPSSPTSPNFIFPIIPGTTPRDSPHIASPRNGNHTDLTFRESVPCKLTILVHDTGIGMSQEEQARIFKRFSQANNRTSHEYGGSGLGLAVSLKTKALYFVSILGLD